MTYDQWVQRATTDAVPPNSDGVLHVGERAALIEQLSYLKKRNAQLVNKQRAVLLAALRVFEAAREPGHVEHLPFRWHEDPKATRWHPAEPSPIIGFMKARQAKKQR